MNQLINPTAENKIQVEDDRTGMSVVTLKRALADNLFYLQGTYESMAKKDDFYNIVIECL